MEAMMKRINFGALFLTIILLGSFAQVKDEFEFKIPPGWAFTNASLSRSGLKAVMLVQDISNENEAYNNIPSRLLVFDENNTILNDLSYPEPKLVLMTRDDSIILIGGVETTNEITVLDSRGRPLFDISTKWRRPYPALLGKEIGLADVDLGNRGEIVGTVSIIDGVTGRERISFGPPAGKGVTGYSGFLPIGEGGQFLTAIGATVCLRTYLRPEETLWRINNIGGNVRKIIPIDADYVGIPYDVNDFHANKIMAGIAILDRHDGKILFRQESHNPQVGLWKFLHGALNVTLEEGDLFFTDYDRLGIRVTKSSSPSAKWNMKQLKKYELINKSSNDEMTLDSRHVVKSKTDVLRITKAQYREKTHIL
jgi:hypothetical protein